MKQFNRLTNEPLTIYCIYFKTRCCDRLNFKFKMHSIVSRGIFRCPHLYFSFIRSTVWCGMLINSIHADNQSRRNVFFFLFLYFKHTRENIETENRRKRVGGRCTNGVGERERANGFQLRMKKGVRLIYF